MEPGTPRYAPEIALPSRAYLPGRTPRPDEEGHAIDLPVLTAENAAAVREYLHGVDLFNHGFHWEAHEAWESLWLLVARGDPVRDHLQGLIQASAALLKLRLGDPAPARTIWARGRARLVGVATVADGERFLGIDLGLVVASVDEAVASGRCPEPPPRIELVWASPGAP